MYEFLSQNPWVVWLSVALIFGTIEMFTLELTAAMLGASALGGLVISLTPAPFWLQVVVACVLAVLLLWLARPPLLALMRAGADNAPTNIEAVVGQSGIVLSAGDDTTDALVKLANGETWTARGAHTVAPGQTVIVTAIDGATAVVEPHPEGQ